MRCASDLGAIARTDLVDGQPVPKDVLKGQTYAFIKPDSAIYAPEFKFAQHGKSGAWMSELLPHTAKIADQLTIMKSLHTEAINHDPAVTFFQTGSAQPGRPTMGAWLSYGLGSANQDLPAFVVLPDVRGLPPGGVVNWSAGFLPAAHQGVAFRAEGEPVPDLSTPASISASRSSHFRSF